MIPGTGGGAVVNYLAEITRDIVLLRLGLCHAEVPNDLKYCLFYFWRDFMDVRDLKIHTPEILLGQSA